MIAAERASLERAKEAANLICGFMGVFYLKSQPLFTAVDCGYTRSECAVSFMSVMFPQLQYVASVGSG